MKLQLQYKKLQTTNYKLSTNQYLRAKFLKNESS